MRISKFQATRMLGEIHASERAAKEATRDAEKRSHASQAQINRHALARNGWEIVTSQGIECDVRKVPR